MTFQKPKQRSGIHETMASRRLIWLEGRQYVVSVRHEIGQDTTLSNRGFERKLVPEAYDARTGLKLITTNPSNRRWAVCLPTSGKDLGIQGAVG